MNDFTQSFLLNVYSLDFYNYGLQFIIIYPEV